MTETWSVVEGLIPPGLTLNTLTGLLSGTPTTSVAASYTFKVQCLAVTIVAEGVFELDLFDPISIVEYSMPSATAGQIRDVNPLKNGNMQWFDYLFWFNGDLYCAMFASHEGETSSRFEIKKSTDHGKTWTVINPSDTHGSSAGTFRIGRTMYYLTSTDTTYFTGFSAGAYSLDGYTYDLLTNTYAALTLPCGSGPFADIGRVDTLLFVRPSGDVVCFIVSVLPSQDPTVHSPQIWMFSSSGSTQVSTNVPDIPGGVGSIDFRLLTVLMDSSGSFHIIYMTRPYGTSSEVSFWYVIVDTSDTASTPYQLDPNYFHGGIGGISDLDHFHTYIGRGFITADQTKMKFPFAAYFPNINFSSGNNTVLGLLTGTFHLPPTVGNTQPITWTTELVTCERNSDYSQLCYWFPFDDGMFAFEDWDGHTSIFFTGFDQFLSDTDYGAIWNLREDGDGSWTYRNRYWSSNELPFPGATDQFSYRGMVVLDSTSPTGYLLAMLADVGSSAASTAIAVLRYPQPLNCPSAPVIVPVSILCASPPAGTIGTPYTHTFPVSGGTGPYTYTFTAGGLPPGLTLTGNVAAGTPTTNGVYVFTIQATDSLGATDSITCSITISTPIEGGMALALNIDDFRLFYTEDEPLTAIECIWQSHFEDVNMPDNQKCWLEVVVDCILGYGIVATVYIAIDNGVLGSLGTITGTGDRQQKGFTLGTDGMLAKNLSVAIDVMTTATSGAQEIHNVYLYYYVEARLALMAASIPTDLGVGKVKQCKELMLDIDASLGGVQVDIYSDLPGNELAIRQTPSAVTTAGRALVKFPFDTTEGYLWRLALTASVGTFRLYSARLLMRTIGVYVEAYESAAGFVWDSEPQTFESGLTHVPRLYAIALSAVPIKRFREISLEMETFGGDVLVTFLTDLPGETQASRFTATVNTASLGRRYVRLPLPAGTNAPIEGRMCRLQLSGTGKFVLYDAAVELLAVGVYVEAYEAAGGAVWDSREMDFGSAKAKEAREIELDVETTGAITATLYSDLPGFTMASVFSATVTTTGRQKIKLPLTAGSAPYNYPMGRMFRVILTGANAFRLYGCKLKVREFGCYLTGDEATGGAVWDSTPIDLGSERLKEFKKLEVEVQTDASATLKVWTDQPAGSLTLQFTTTISTGGARESVKIPLTPGIRGRLLQVEVSGAGVRLFNGRVWVRPMNEPKAQWEWAPLPIEPTPPQWKDAPFMINPTPPGGDPAQWFWGKIMSVEPTADTWTWVDVNMEITGT